MELINDDCFLQFQKMQNGSVDCVFTSPPYNRKRNDKYTFFDDRNVDYLKFLTELINESLRISSGFVFVNIQKNYYNKIDVFKIIGLFAQELKEIFIWNKSNPMPASGFNITNDYEFILVLSKKNESLKSNRTYTINQFSTSVAKMDKIHRAVMNQKVSDFFIENFTKENETILDPLMGLGTTGLSCKRFNRSFVGIEISEDYFNIAKDLILES